MIVYNTSSINDKYKAYVERFNKIATKAGRVDEAPMSISKFAQSYGIMYEETRAQKMNAMKGSDKLVQSDLETSSWKQAREAHKANRSGFTYDDIRYGTGFWDMIKEEYHRTRDSNYIGTTYFDSL